MRKEMSYWGLDFTGEASEDPEEFLRKIRRGRRLVAIRDEDMLSCVAFFLSGKALRWYEAKEDLFDSWDGFELSFRRRFGAPDEHLILRDNIARRRQEEGESVAGYFEGLTALMRWLERPMTRDEQIYFAYRNLLPEVQLVISRCSFMDLDELEDAARAAEQKLEIANRHRVPKNGANNERERRGSAELPRSGKIKTRKEITAVVTRDTDERCPRVSRGERIRAGRVIRIKASGETDTTSQKEIGLRRGVKATRS